MKAQIFADFHEAYEANVEIQSDKKIEIVIDWMIKDFIKPIPPDTIRFFVTIQCERYYNGLVLGNQDCFDYLLTYDTELLSLPKARLMVGFPAWVHINDSMDKEFSVSTVISGRVGLPGHNMRKELLARREEIKIPNKIYFSTINKFDTDYSKELTLGYNHFCKDVVMDSMFHIAIDSVNRENFFSEKLIDPLITKTVPIFWGCPNLGDFFNLDGIIKVNSVDDIISTCNVLTEKDYYSRADAINENFDKAVKLSDYGKCIERTINNILNG